MRNYYDAIVVGAGPSGSAAALVMAENGLSVALLERGDKPGTKTMFGGTIYAETTQEIVPGFWEEAPVERAVISDQLLLLEHDSAVHVGFTGLRYGKAPYNKFTVSRAKFDLWLAQKAQQAGADLHNRALVKSLIYEKTLFGKGKVIGVKLDSGDIIRSSLVILAEGVNAFLTKEAGLRSKIPANAVTLFTKEVLSLSSEKIQDRFSLENGEGVTIGLLGWPMAGAVGKAGIWTNKDSISLVVGAYLNQMRDKGLDPCILMQRLKSHPLVKRLIKGAETVEYQSQMIPKGGIKYMPQLYSDGLMVVGDAAVMVSGRRGTDLAMLSGKYAGETAVQAKAKGDFTQDILAGYHYKLNKTFFMKNIKKSKGTIGYYDKYQDADYLLSSLANEVSYKFFQEEALSDKAKMMEIRKIIAAKQMPLKSIDDLYMGLKYWGFF